MEHSGHSYHIYRRPTPALGGWRYGFLVKSICCMIMKVRVQILALGQQARQPMHTLTPASLEMEIGGYWGLVLPVCTLRHTSVYIHTKILLKKQCLD